jgi:Alkylmercury lyase
MITLSTLHYTIIKYFIEMGYAPGVNELSDLLNAGKPDVIHALYELHEYHGVVLHPHAPEIWVIHPFATAPTNFIVRSGEKMWWGNCAWCSLGIAALLKEDVTITTSLGAHGDRIDIHIKDGLVEEGGHCIHFPVPMKEAWNNVVYTCSNMLVFKDETQVDEWSAKHNIPKGDVQPVSRVWDFAKEWYGNHLNPAWKKWTLEEASVMFRKFNFTHPVWNLDPSGKRF